MQYIPPCLIRTYVRMCAHAGGAGQIKAKEGWKRRKEGKKEGKNIHTEGRNTRMKLRNDGAEMDEAKTNTPSCDVRMRPVSSRWKFCRLSSASACTASSFSVAARCAFCSTSICFARARCYKHRQRAVGNSRWEELR